MITQEFRDIFIITEVDSSKIKNRTNENKRKEKLKKGCPYDVLFIYVLFMFHILLLLNQMYNMR